MKTWAILLILIGSGLAAYGFSGLAGSFSARPYVEDVLDYSGSFGWPQNSQIEIVIGVVLLIYGVILRKDAK
jgi:hypothetical protein